MNTMALYFIGDVQGCDAPLARLLQKIDFSPSRDTVYLLGDLVNRGPDSVGVLRRLQGLGGAARCLLGNHDMHLLALAHGIRKPHRGDTVNQVLDAPDRAALLDWLRQQRLAVFEHGCLMVHAAVLPSWTAEQTVALAAEVEAVLRGPSLADFLQGMYGDEPLLWSDALQGTARLRAIVNVLTRLRFCTPEGRMEFEVKSGPDTAPAGFLPWYEAPGRRTADVTVAFGHWSTLGYMDRGNVVSLDTGCAWGGCLSALRFDGGARTLFQENC